MRWLLGNANLPSLLFGLAAATTNSMHSTPPPIIVAWLIDGNNLKCSRGVPDERSAIIDELQKMASPRIVFDDDDTLQQQQITTDMIANTVLVFDGDHDETFEKTISSDGWFQVVITDGQTREKDRADHYMIDIALPELQLQSQKLSDKVNSNTNCSRGRVHLVSADKELGKRAVATRLMGGGSIVHPPKFWKHYLPNLQERQRQLQQQEGAS